jgi:GNAT superfamily N-acetyltransferase
MPPDFSPPGQPAAILENLRLGDGTPVVARALVPGDRLALAEAYRKLSPASRYHRFWTHGGDAIGGRMLDRVLHQDAAMHITWAVLDPARVRFPGMGAASWWRDDAHADVAEFSVVVLDEDHGRGIGTLLLAILWNLALQAGIRTLVGHTLTENRRAADWMRDTGANGHWDGHQLIFSWSLDAPASALPDTRAARDLAARLAETAPFFQSPLNPL